MSVLTSNIAIEDEDIDDRYTARYNWQYQMRGAHSVNKAVPFAGLWPLSKMCSGDPSVNLTIMGGDVSDGRLGAGFEEWAWGLGGQMGQVFIRGVCIDVNGNTLAGATIQSFRTSDGLLAGTTTSDATGNFQVGTPYAGVAHYCNAYYTSGALAGTTVNTLIPTN